MHALLYNRKPSNREIITMLEAHGDRAGQTHQGITKGPQIRPFDQVRQPPSVSSAAVHLNGNTIGNEILSAQAQQSP